MILAIIVLGFSLIFLSLSPVEWLSVFTFIIIFIGAIKKVWNWILESDYDEILEQPFEMHFIIPPKNKYKINYHKQTDIPQRVDEITMSSNSKDTIFLWIKPKIDLDIREQQFGLGDKPSNPKILKYNNPFLRKSNVPQTWFLDWWHNYHIVDKISRGKDDVIVHGFEIETHNKGQYTLDIRINISCNRYKSVEKYKTHIPHYTDLKIKVV